MKHLVSRWVRTAPCRRSIMSICMPLVGGLVWWQSLHVNAWTWGMSGVFWCRIVWCSPSWWKGCPFQHQLPGHGTLSVCIVSDRLHEFHQQTNTSDPQKDMAATPPIMSKMYWMTIEPAAASMASASNCVVTKRNNKEREKQEQLNWNLKLAIDVSDNNESCDYSYCYYMHERI